MAYKKTINMFCPFCNKECDISDEWTKTKRNTTQYFHAACFHDYGKIVIDAKEWVKS